MMLVIGGVASGKRTFLCSLGHACEDMSDDIASGSAVLVDAQELVRDDGIEVAPLAQEIACNKQAVTIVEVGSGIVPAGPGERVWRDRVGALARELAARSDVVVRMVCGIPVPLKGDLPQVSK